MLFCTWNCKQIGTGRNWIWNGFKLLMGWGVVSFAGHCTGSAPELHWIGTAWKSKSLTWARFCSGTALERHQSNNFASFRFEGVCYRTETARELPWNSTRRPLLEKMRMPSLQDLSRHWIRTGTAEQLHHSRTIRPHGSSDVDNNEPDEILEGSPVIPSWTAVSPRAE